jgi:leucyl aminopeptidase
MIPSVTLTNIEQELGHLVVIISKFSHLPAGIFSTAEKKYMKEQVENLHQQIVSFNRLSYFVWVYFIKEEKDISKRLEATRKAGDQIAGTLNAQKAKRVAIFDAENDGDITLALAEGMALGCYQFLKYKKDRENENTLENIEIYSKVLEEEGDNTSKLNILLEAVCFCRDLVNEPNSFLTATLFAKEVEKMAEGSGVTTEVLDFEKIAALKMGGLLGVNQGSFEPPTFTILEWKPAGAINVKPVVFVGKGVVYDTGGMNLKPGDSMLTMKHDMAGAAAVAATIIAIAKANIPVHVVGLMPATDNRPGERALVSGDVITIHNGTTVEVLNTDAEGRLILADALSYAKNFNPELVIDLATLTGAAVRAIGKFGAAAMQSNAREALESLKSSGYHVYERLVEFPMWDEYGDQIKSDLADLKNLGPPEAGMITAGKFLEKFTSYPYIHLDIAGPAFNEKRDSYRALGGTGYGVRLLFEFVRRFVEGERVNG